MFLVAVAWMYVVLMMAAAEASSSNGSVLGAVMTVLLYGALPLGIVLYLMHTPARRARRRAGEASLMPQEPPPVDPHLPAPTDGDLESPSAAALQPHRRGHAPGDAVPPVGKEP